MIVTWLGRPLTTTEVYEYDPEYARRYRAAGRVVRRRLRTVRRYLP